MKIGICDDDVSDCRRLADILAGLRKDDEVECFTDGSALLRAVEEGAVFSCLFLDILMPEMSGIDLLSKLRDMKELVSVIFVTSSPDFAVEAFANRAVHYIMKPVKREDVAEALGRVSKDVSKRCGITIKTKSFQRFIYLDEIDFCESELHEIHIQLSNGDMVSCYGTINSLKEQLGDDFLLISRGLLVNMDYILEMQGKSCILKDHRKILLSRKNLKQIHNAYNDFIFSRLTNPYG